MTTDSPIPQADPADVAEQGQDAFPSGADEDVAAFDQASVPIDANEADIAEQRTEAPGLMVEDDADDR